MQHENWTCKGFLKMYLTVQNERGFHGWESGWVILLSQWIVMSCRAGCFELTAMKQVWCLLCYLKWLPCDWQCFLVSITTIKYIIRVQTVISLVGSQVGRGLCRHCGNSAWSPSSIQGTYASFFSVTCCIVAFYILILCLFQWLAAEGILCSGCPCVCLCISYHILEVY